MIRNPDMVAGMIEGKELTYPDFYKTFILGNTKSEIVKHDCLYEGREMYKKLKDHVIFGQFTVDKNFGKGPNPDRNFEFTPIVQNISPLIPHKSLAGGDKIWRYISFKKFESLISTKSLHFARIDQFEDNLEGVSSFMSIKNILADSSKSDKQKQESLRLYHLRMENNRKVSYCCCWHINKKINLKLWEIYGNNSDNSIALETNVSRVNKALLKSGLPFLNEPVTYFTENYFNQNAYWFPTMFKRDEFKHENEYRTILFVHGFDIKGLKVKVNLEQLILKVHVHPNATKDFFKEIQSLIKKSRMKISINKVKL